MKEKMTLTVFLGLVLLFILGCSNEDTTETNETSEPTGRSFSMGFTTWSFGPELQDVDDTYAFIANNADVYVEHLDNQIPWNAWINGQPLPQAFTDDVVGRATRKIPNTELVLSVGLLNTNRGDLIKDVDGSIPNYSSLNDAHIQEAYTQHIRYLTTLFSPDYLVIAIEVNELWLRNNGLWNGYVQLINEVMAQTKSTFPNLPISASISLHNLYEADIPNEDTYVNEVLGHINQMDFIAVSYYPFLKNQNTVSQFQENLDFLHSKTTKPIAFVESGHLAENLVVPGLGVSIDGNSTEQKLFLETLLTNAQTNDYLMVNWWAHRDYDALWEVFPPEVRDIGQLWRDTGLLDENGGERPAFLTWQTYFSE
ncbi:Hypothetical protein I595_1937 [Croceitalea dokdonensis DOKDO 023]|uniref:Arabinogalactan endo-beta-1,4-galactanase n=1 Tax=Croceitalea dokdonensis DOKDO 023 TaxID=1300341 RepID=A0A0P7B287_9FLAO|nr:glycosyl hydrolase 53 family protein [Croceitalea dokdonensis]KPM32287.1 Hypothetical protein I595_1937 [Croceitalea dokdonensis DOKDO 023]